jgi:lipopolysaccharide transport system ATP-binding protein
MNQAIVIQDLGKRFRRYRKDRPFTLQEAVVTGFGRLQPLDWFWALREISFSVPYGEVLGVIGANGAGKSTLLGLIGGIGRPEEGRLEVNGRVGGLLELGAGFHPDLTGRENVIVNGIICGLTRREVDRRFAEIVAFAELEGAINDPLRTYSTGMRMRLGFSIAAHTEPEILLVDEVLAVGDIAFQQKCLDRIKQYQKRGCTIVIVSHNTNQIREFCDRVIWLQAGRIQACDGPALVVSQYEQAMQQKKTTRP